jgi:hypothetical protein
VSTHGLNTQRMSAVQKVWSSYVYATIYCNTGLLQGMCLQWPQQWTKNDKTTKHRHCKTNMVVILTADEFLRKGLLLVGFDVHRQQNMRRKTNTGCFNMHFGSDPVVHAQIWKDLQMSDNEDLLVSEKGSAHLFLQGSHFFLKHHSKEQEQSGTFFKMCKTTARNLRWCFAGEVQALKEEKVSLKFCKFAVGHPETNTEPSHSSLLVSSVVLPDCLA